MNTILFRGTALAFWTIFWVCGLAPAGLHAQATKASFVGTVTDASGAAVPEAAITIEETRTGIIRKLMTGQGGTYSAPNVDPGLYRITVEKPGFRTVARLDLELLVNTTLRVDVELQPGTVTEVVDVRGEPSLLQTDRADTGLKITARQVTDMPLLFNRNFQGLINLVPGVIRIDRQQSEFYNPQDSLQVRANGQGRVSNNFQLEGVDNNIRNNRLAVLIPPIEAVDTVDVSTSNYEAELGRAGGAVANVSLRSGTNQVHGSAFEFNRVSRLAARNVFGSSKQVTVYNLFGGAVGGPIVHNRTFFFGDVQITRDRRGDLTLATIPIMAFRAGDLSASPTTIYDPATGRPDGTGREPFANKQIPTSRISPISKKILDLVPAPTSAGLATNFENAVTRKKDTISFDAKVDHQLNTNTRLAVRYSFQRPVTDEPGIFGPQGGPLVGSVAGTSGHGVFQSQNGGFNIDHIFSPTLIAAARIGISRYRNDARQVDYGTNASAALGIPGVNISDYSSGIVSINVDGFSSPVVGFSISLPWLRAETGYYYVGSVTKIQGKHTIKGGIEYRRQWDVSDLPDTYGARGSFNFGAGPTSLNGDRNTGFGNAFAGFLLDAPTTASREVRNIVPVVHQISLFTYLQDKWQVTPRLTVDLGLRHEVYFPSTPRYPGGLSNYDPDTNTLRLGGIGGIPSNTGLNGYSTGFLPRIGASLRLNAKTVLRAGFGGSLITPGLETKALYNFPIRQYFLFSGPNTYSTAGALAQGFPVPSAVVIPQDGIIRNPADASFHYVDRNFKEAMLRSWNIALQRQLPGNFVLEAAYVGNRAERLAVTRDMNAATTPGTGQTSQPFFQKYGLRNPVYNDYYPSDGQYDSLQAKFDRRFADGFLLTTAYTYSKAISYDSFINAFPSMNRGRNVDNPTHIFVQSYIYELPFGRGKRWLPSGAGRLLAGGWQVSGVLSMQTGAPLNFTTSAATLNAPGNGNRPNINGKPEIYGAVGRGTFWFDTSKFSAPASATFGNTGRNILSGPGLVNLDLSLFRRFRFRERLTAEFRAEGFNASNTPHFNNPTTNFSDAAFGQVTTARADQRVMQMGLKIAF